MINYKNNQSVKFVLPLATRINANTLFTKEFKGAFIGDVERPQWDGKLLLIYEYPGTIESSKLDAKICREDLYTTSYDYTDQRLVVYVLELPDLYKEDLDLILDGKYNKISPEAKLMITKFWYDYTKDIDIISSILNGSNEWFIPEMENELFDKMNY
jgi:hypothetical protein